MMGKKVRMIKILTSQMVNTNGSNDFETMGYDFSVTDPNFLRVCSYSCKYHKNLYFYSDQRRGNELIISTTMDFTNSFKFLFALELKNTPHHYIFNFQTLADLIRSNQQQLYSKERLRQRLRLAEDGGKKKVINFMQADEIPTYYYPPMKECSEIWLVPRYMHPVELEENMKIRFYYQSDKDAYSFKDVVINKLTLNYIIEEVCLSEMKNNSTLADQNQQNLLHICDQIQQQKNTEIKCYICLQGGEDKIDKRYPNLLIDSCYCSGGCKFVHVKCLSSWIMTKQSGGGITCNICKKPLPQFLEVTRINQNKQKIVRYFHLIGSNKTPRVQLNNQTIELFNNQQIFLGSNIDSNFKINSFKKQKYAKITYAPQQERAFIVDLKTRFGTLINKTKMVVKLNKKEHQPYTCTILIDKTMYNITIEEEGEEKID